MLSGGEKAKVKNIIVAIKGEYSKIFDIISDEKKIKKQDNINTLFASSKKVFMWMAHLPTTLINSSSILSRGFDTLQEANRFASISAGDKKKVELLMNSIKVIPSIQEELIKQINDDNNYRERVLKDIMDELGIENPNKKKKKRDEKFNSMSFDDWFNDD